MLQVGIGVVESHGPLYHCHSLSLGITYMAEEDFQHVKCHRNI